MDALHVAQRKRDIECNRERLRMQVFPQPKRPSGAIIQAEEALRARRDEAIQARGNVIGHMLGYSQARESTGLPRWCKEVQRWQWERRLLDHFRVHRLPGTAGTPTAATSFVITEPYVSDEGATSLPIWRRWLVPHKLHVMRLPDDWRIHNPSNDHSKIFMIAAPEMIERLTEFERSHSYLKPRKTKFPLAEPPDMSNVHDIMSRKTA
jgi:hypothetical protein